MTQIEQIKAEIERQRVDILRKVYPIHHIDVLDEILAFIDSLPEEQPSEDLEKEIDSYWNRKTGFQPPFAVVELRKKNIANIARHFAQWQKEQEIKAQKGE